MLGIGRRSVRESVKGLWVTQRLPEKRDKMKKLVLTFMERDDNSTCMPGMKDVKKVDSDKKQIRVFHGYMYNLHLKF